MAGLTPPESMERSVELFLRAMRNTQALKKNEKKKKAGKKKAFHCNICNVKVIGAATFEFHLKGKKHRMNSPLSKSCKDIEYIQRYEHLDGNVVIKCELCGEQLLDVVNHLNTSSHILAFLEANFPKVFGVLQIRGLHNISETELKKIALAEKNRQEYMQTFQHDVNPDNLEQGEGIYFYKKNRQSEDCEPPRKILRKDDQHCNDISSTVTDHEREKNCAVDQNEKKCSSSVERQIRLDCQEYKKSETESHFKHSETESPYEITCNKDLYNFLQYFRIADEADVIFVQQIVTKFKSQLEEFYDQTKEEKVALDLNCSKNQEDGKLKAAESIVQQADSTTTSTLIESTANSTDVVDHCEGEVTANQCNSMVEDSTTTSSLNESTTNSTDVVDHCEGEFTANQGNNMLKDSISKSVSVNHSSLLCHTTKKPIIRPSVLDAVLKSHNKSITSTKKEPYGDAAVKEPKLDCTSMFKSITNTEIFTGSTKKNIFTVHDDTSSTSSIDKQKSIIGSSTLCSAFGSSHLPLDSHVVIKNECDTVVSDECQVSPTVFTGQSQVPQEASFSFLATSTKKERESMFSPEIPILNPNTDKSILKETSIKTLSVSPPMGARELSERENNVLPYTLCEKPVKSSFTPLSIKKEPMLPYPDVSSTHSPLISLSPSDFGSSDVSLTSSSRHSCSLQSAAEICSTFTKVPRIVPGNVKTSVQDQLNTSKENLLSSLHANEDEQAFVSSVCTSPPNYSQPSQETTLKFSQPAKVKSCSVSNELHMSISGCCPSITCVKKTMDHSFELGRDQPQSMYLDSSLTKNKNKLVPALEKSRTDNLNCPRSSSNTHDSCGITFGGKKNMHISELISEVAKFADTKPILKGIDINQVVRLLIQNRSEKTREGSHNNTP
ncbi:serine-rich adhesin for platelets-like isoform X2 [Hyla sarda]|uniref:serine-rich adhesin for platelets-like isoform X2 n=1 Tax=Hyla sarda TaxID=327740 RepID=UPI0024C431AC|nr:serine-rich adhesin for platelets-like isoform X2 [Hyla sarda]